ncbi:FkbM family methyltransferase [Synechococcus sp. CBW1002]|uniref:FkbM family methyltransferase n=1 Tax=Synechococcus sp. CBW1002 TaxID=1353134 RepID=UPI0018CDCFC0|nr:FkbM family methyltransferase [Synechococcus sp. CBW1002]QPN59130.1 FkbM family methyltransferase [Synechococcus sp. CBW1002]
MLHAIQNSPFYRLINKGYESRFDEAMMNSLEPGMRVFDVGANVGYYTEKFADCVGPSGSVHAFEPVPASASMIKGMVAARPWIEVHQCAVADQPGELVMDAECGSTSPTNKVAISTLGGAGTGMTVPVETIDLIAEKVGVPAAIKIDVEGYEWHVLEGSRKTLSSSDLHHVFVEVHFALLEQRGLINAAADIASVLAGAGFEVEYTDFSHIHAFRRS